MTKERILRVSVAGDLCMRNLTDVVDDTYSKEALRLVQPILARADFRLINLENAVIEEGTPIHKSKPLDTKSLHTPTLFALGSDMTKGILMASS
jgi:hypothetical protein